MWGSLGVWWLRCGELRSGGFAVWGSLGVWWLRCERVSACGSYGAWKLRSVGVEGYEYKQQKRRTFLTFAHSKRCCILTMWDERRMHANKFSCKNDKGNGRGKTKPIAIIFGNFQKRPYKNEIPRRPDRCCELFDDNMLMRSFFKWKIQCILF